MEFTIKPARHFSSGNHFQRIGTHRGHGASAIRPKLQMQNSYDVAPLTKNDMIDRPLKDAPGEKQVATPKETICPGLEGRYTKQADGNILVYDGTYTTKGGTLIHLDGSTIVRKGATVSIRAGLHKFDPGFSNVGATSSVPMKKRRTTLAAKRPEPAGRPSSSMS